MASDASNAGKFPDNHDPSLPQWVRSRLKMAMKEKNCHTFGGTHKACRCILERLINAEAELSELRQKLKDQESD